jgi:hypothetical protein
VSGGQRTRNALRGLRLLLAFDVRAWNCFDRSLRGFWASFIVAVLLAPLSFTHVIMQFGERTPHLTFVPYLIVESLSYIISWTLFPFVMMYLVVLLQRPQRYFSYMVAYNWLQLPLGVFVYLVHLGGDFHVLPPGAAESIQLFSLLAFFVYGSFIAGYALQLGMGTALSIVVLDFVLGLITEQLISRI